MEEPRYDLALRVFVVDEAWEGSIDAAPKSSARGAQGAAQAPALEADGEVKAGERPVHSVVRELERVRRRGGATELGAVQDVVRLVLRTEVGVAGSSGVVPDEIASRYLDGTRLFLHSTVLVQICAVLTDYISYEKNECVREPVQLKPIT